MKELRLKLLLLTSATLFALSMGCAHDDNSDERTKVSNAEFSEEEISTFAKGGMVVDEDITFNLTKAEKKAAKKAAKEERKAAKRAEKEARKAARLARRCAKKLAKLDQKYGKEAVCALVAKKIEQFANSKCSAHLDEAKETEFKKRSVAI